MNAKWQPYTKQLSVSSYDIYDMPAKAANLLVCCYSMGCLSSQVYQCEKPSAVCIMVVMHLLCTMLPYVRSQHTSDMCCSVQLLAQGRRHSPIAYQHRRLCAAPCQHHPGIRGGLGATWQHQPAA
jgi:hypothetical protein